MKATYLCVVFVFIIYSKYRVHCDSDSSSKIDPDVVKSYKNGDNPNLLVGCQPPPSETPLQDILPPILRKTREMKSDKMLRDILQNTVTSILNSLKALTDLLNGNGIESHFLWLSDQFVIYELPEGLLQKLASLPIVLWIRLDKNLIPPFTPNPKPRSPPTGNSTWNLGLIDARCKNITCLGKGVKIGIIDTGVQLNHTELFKNWAGQPYGWWNGTGPKTSTAFPEDEVGTGTQTMGLAVGKNIGVAPDATWIACQACTQSSCPQSGFLLCAQYMACPWQWNDTSPNKKTMNCTYRPDVVIRGSGAEGGGQLFDDSLFWFYDSIKYLHDQGIITVSRMGDSGPDCNTGYIPGVYDIELAVGAVDETVTIWDKSSRGPVVTNRTFTVNTTAKGTCPVFLGDSNGCLGTGPKEAVCTIIKPDIVAPGVNLNTSTISNTTTAYAIVSGTGFAVPQVAGIIALMICSNRTVTWDYKRAYQVLTKSADISMINLKNGGKDSIQRFAASSHLMCDLIMSGICEGFPNNLYGYGLAYACGAVTAAKNLKV